MTVSKWRRIPIETDTEAILHVRIGEAGTIRKINGSSIPPSWRETADVLVRTKGLAVVLGDVDAGKSTLCTYLANKCLDSGVRISIIDGDVGQADIGPPTTVSSTTISDKIFGLHYLKPQKSYFVGDTSPSSVPEKLVQSIARLKDELFKRNEIMILNTDGWVREEDAVRHKLQLLQILQPDLVLGLSCDQELDPILELQRHATLRLEPSSLTRTRTRAERKKAREEGYRRFLQNPRQIDLRLNTIRLRMYNTPNQQRIDQDLTHRGTLAGLLDEKGELLSIGRVVRIANGMARITTAVVEKPRIVELGAVILSARFQEVGYDS